MQPDVTKLVMTSDLNAFKNQSVQRGFLPMPTSVGASSRVTNQITFTLGESANFIQAYVFASDYGDYFNFLDSKYHDAWRSINNSVATGSGDFLVFSSNGLINYLIRISLNANIVTAILSIQNISGSPITINHSSYLIPITFIEYTLDR